MGLLHSNNIAVADLLGLQLSALDAHEHRLAADAIPLRVLLHREELHVRSNRVPR